jgi:hypothetical protein
MPAKDGAFFVVRKKDGPPPWLTNTVGSRTGDIHVSATEKESKERRTKVKKWGGILA